MTMKPEAAFKNDTVESIVTKLKVAAECQREVSNMSESEQMEILKSHLAQDASRYDPDILNATKDAATLDVPGKLTYASACYALLFIQIKSFTLRLKRIYRIPFMRRFCDGGGEFMRGAIQATDDLDTIMNAPHIVDEARLKKLAEYIYELPNNTRHVRMRFAAGIVILLNIALIIFVMMWRYYNM